MKKSALLVSLITLGIANLAFVISYFFYLGDIFKYSPFAGIVTFLALLLSFAAIIYAVIGLVKSKDASYNPSPMIFGGYGFFVAAFIASRFAITLIEGRIYLSLSLVANFLFFFAIIIMMILVCKNSTQYKGNKKYIDLTNSRLSFLSSFAILGLVFLNLIGMFLIKDVFYFNRLFTIIGYIFIMLTSILVLIGYSGYVKERGVLPNDKDREFVNAKPRREGPAPATSSSGSTNPKEAAVQNAMKMYGMTREEAEQAVGYNKVDDNPANQFVGMGLGLNVQQAQQGLNQSAPAATNEFDKQTMQAARASTPTSIQNSGAEIADLKRQLLQGKITRAEFDEKLAELKKQ